MIWGPVDNVLGLGDQKILERLHAPLVLKGRPFEIPFKSAL